MKCVSRRRESFLISRSNFTEPGNFLVYTFSRSFFCGERSDILNQSSYKTVLKKKEITHKSCRNYEDAVVDEDALPARRRRSSTASLDRRESHGGREVDSPQLQRASTLHRRRRPRSGSPYHHLQELSEPAPPLHGHRDGKRAHRTTTEPCARGRRRIRGCPPKSTTTRGDHRRHQNARPAAPSPPRRRRQAPTRAYTVHMTRSVAPRPSRRRSGRRREGDPANRRR